MRQGRPFAPVRPASITGLQRLMKIRVLHSLKNLLQTFHWDPDGPTPEQKKLHFLIYLLSCATRSLTKDPYGDAVAVHSESHVSIVIQYIYMSLTPGLIPQDWQHLKLALTSQHRSGCFFSSTQQRTVQVSVLKHANTSSKPTYFRIPALPCTQDNLEEHKQSNLHAILTRSYEIVMDLTFQLIEKITNNFHDDQQIGSGAYGKVYKGVHDGKEIAVKKLFNMQGIDDKEFTNEFRNLMKVEHRNIIRLTGYCYEIRHRHVDINGDLIFAKIIERLLCFEYMEGGSLAKHISDESCGLDWPARYKIIKGICEGLNHLHNGRSNDHIYHLDLKPENILLDKNMMPVIADFGMSRLLASSKTHITQTMKGTLGYMPPEFIDKRRITKKYDVFSVGVIILKIIAGPEGYTNCCEMSSPQHFIKNVHEKWKISLQVMSKQENTYKINILAVQRCIDLAVRCVEADPIKRPTIMEVVDELNILDADMKKLALPGQQTAGSKDLEVDPALELRFPFELNKDISACMQLINKTDDFIAFNIKTNKMKYTARPSNGTMPPYSSRYITFTLRAQEEEPPYMRCQDMVVVQSTRLGMDSGDEITDEFFEKAVPSMVVDDVKLPIVYVV